MTTILYPCRVISCATGFLLALTLGVNAQTSSPTPASDAQTSKQTETVVVTGTKPTQPETLDTVVSQFIDTHAARDSKTGQFVRDIATGVCPVTMGLPAGFNAFVTARIEAVAKSIGAPAQAVGACKPNVEVLFSDEPQKLVDDLADKTRGAILGVHFVRDSNRISRMTRPIQSWYVTATQSAETSSAPIASSDGPPDVAGKYVLDDSYSILPTRTALGSRLDARIQSLIVNVLIVADSNKLKGHDIGPIADYAALLALSQPKSLDGCSDLPSILDMMSDGCSGRPTPIALTDSDIAYLKALYKADLAAQKSGEEESVMNGMENTLSAH